ncbi:hypothetical protein AWC38_SpisGene20212 [Stylophora pistillata]|uniref:Uncharacterized protein n=1 Tax=Stylophora pistillata TaxID=50429 RepID=A0A2B4RGF5_STYPI|nr:hypothetical protein AWC38_SpisGene20212 [Stylophora pistillata]
MWGCNGTLRNVRSSNLRGDPCSDSAGLKVDGNAKIWSLEDEQQYKFLGVLESLKQEEKLALYSAAKEYLQTLSVIWSSPLADYHSVVASNQFAMPAMSYFLWTQYWPITKLKQIDREVRKTVVENGGKHPCGSTSLLYSSRNKGGRGLRSIKTEYKETRVKAAVNLYQNRDPAMKMVRDFEERAESVGHQALTKEAAAHAKEYGLQLQLEYPDLVCVIKEGEMIPGKRVKNLLKRHRESRIREEVREQRWHRKLVTERGRGEELRAERCFCWVSDWRACPTHTITGLSKLYEQLLPTRLYTIHKTRVSDSSDSACRLCGTAPGGMAHIVSACPALAQTKYLERHDAVLKVLFFKIIFDLGCIGPVPRGILLSSHSQSMKHQSWSKTNPERSLPEKKKQIEELNAILESELTDTASQGEGKFVLTDKEDFVSRATQVNVEMPCDHRFSLRVLLDLADTQAREENSFNHLTGFNSKKEVSEVDDGDSIMAEKGFDIEEDLKKIGLQLNIPPFSKEKPQLN